MKKKKKTLTVLNILILIMIIAVVIIGSKKFNLDQKVSESVPVENNSVEEEKEKEITYKDIAESDEKYQIIMWATEKGLVQPDENGNFNPDQVSTEAEFAQMVVYYFPSLKANVMVEKSDNPEEHNNMVYNVLKDNDVTLDGMDNPDVQAEPVIKGVVAKTLMNLVSDENIRYQSHAIELLVNNNIWTEVENYIEATDEEITKYELVETFKKMEENNLVEVK